jgi:hypothetical protein
MRTEWGDGPPPPGWQLADWPRLELAGLVLQAAVGIAARCGREDAGDALLGRELFLRDLFAQRHRGSAGGASGPANCGAMNRWCKIP